MYQERSFIGRGVPYLGPYAGGKKRDVGNCSALKIGFSEDKKTLPNYRTGGGGVANSQSIVSAMTCSMTLSDFDEENLALATFGASSAVAAGSVTDESHTAYVGGLVRFDNLPDTSTIVVTDATGVTTYVLDTDYSVNAAGIVPISGGAISDAATILVDYTKVAGNVVQALTQSSQEWSLTLVGLNDAQSGKSVVVDLHRVKFSPAGELGFITDDFGNIEITGEVLADSNITGTGLSQFMKIEQAA
ncbi:MAG: hypothetical protein OQL08_09165 [Gammaproteobacteria bacterium]|nr:hypothetical protein [Gammaproteobacteria bacterium]